MSAVELNHVVKTFGRIRALNDLSLQIPSGSLCGVVGPNGSGKSTLFSTIAGLLRVNSGSVNVWGQGAYNVKASSGRLSLMPQDSVPSPHSSIFEHLLFYAQLQGLTRVAADEQASYWLDKVSLGERSGSRFDQLSHGMKRRFSIAQAFLAGPELILLDEPTGGLDPELAAAMRTLFAEQRGRATLLISSHNLSELEAICDYIVILEKGHLVRQGSLNSLLGASQEVSLRLAAAPDLEQLSRVLPTEFELSWKEPSLEVCSPGSMPLQEANARILNALLEQKIGILGLSSGNSLERSYLLTKNQ